MLNIKCFYLFKTCRYFFSCLCMMGMNMRKINNVKFFYFEAMVHPTVRHSATMIAQL